MSVTFGFGAGQIPRKAESSQLLDPQPRSAACVGVSADLTLGMSSLEVTVVLLTAAASKRERRRLAAFFREYCNG